jgi:hypothetical protein
MSNSLLVDDNEIGTSTPGDLAQLKKDLTEEQSQTQGGASSNDSADKPKDDVVPAKYRGKSIEDVIEMHQNAESELGRKGNELNQFKRMTDSLLDLDTKRRNDLAIGGATEEQIEESTLPEISSTELLENPTQALAKVLDARDKTNESKRTQQEQDDAAAKIEAKFVEAHPDADVIANDPAFIKWVAESNSRSLLGYHASRGDLVSGDALLAEWKGLNSATSTDIMDENTSTEDDVTVTRNVQDDPGLAAARRASTESTGQSQTTDAPTGKIYRRLDLIRLKLTDPEAYGDEGFQREIMKAYSEGRVK